MTKIQKLETDIIIHRANIARINAELLKLKDEKAQTFQKISDTYDKIEEIEFRKEEMKISRMYR